MVNLYPIPPARKPRPSQACDNRLMRLAIGGRCLGIPQDHYGVVVAHSLVDDALRLAPMRPKAGCVYVLGAVGLGIVKVGWSGDAVSRIRTVSSYLPFSSLVVGYRDASSPVLESDAHKALRRWHHKGEWFKLTSGVRQVLRDMLAIEFSDATAEAIGVSDV